ncbi:MAG: hypothetical protein H7177_00435 [Rhizobacter sp.]|nr:hypothetical protein [Bacteriovorax sp.]
MKKNFCLFAFFLCVSTSENVNAQKLSFDLPSNKISAFLFNYPQSDGTSRYESLKNKRWKKFSPEKRLDMLIYIQQLNSFSLVPHKASSCFIGKNIEDHFFTPDIKIANVPDGVKTTRSTDKFLIALQFTHIDPKTKKKTFVHFRVPNCGFNDKKFASSNKAVSSLNLPATSDNYFASSFQKVKDENGFSDVETSGKDKATLKKIKVHRIRTDFDKALEIKPERPWAGLSIETTQSGKILSKTIKQYILSNLVLDNKNQELNLIPKNNKNTFWCEMPWMNQTPFGREALHGLTKIRPSISHSIIYPDIFSKDTSAQATSNWGVTYYNSIACKTIYDVFGSSKTKFNNPPLWEKVKFDEGTLIVKFLFTAASFSSIDGTFSWNAHISDTGENSRSIRKVNLLQMDVALKDSSIKGSKKTNNNWMMFTYYYDATFNDTDKDFQTLPREFRRLRPEGIQSGFDKSDNIVFQDAITNQKDGMLNGPIDNFHSSCFSCHGTAGTSVGNIPGVTSEKVWVENYLNKPSFDFSHQFGIARRYYETRPQK